MNSLLLLLDPVLLNSTTTVSQLAPGYILGAFLAFLILGYLVYSLIKPEKF